MATKRRRIVSKDSFTGYLQNLDETGVPYMVEQRHSEATLRVYGKKVFSADISKTPRTTKISGQQLTLYAQVKNQVMDFILKSNNDVEQVNPLYARGAISNRPFWRTLPVGARFFYVDANHCYWRIAYIKGYISSDLYFKVTEPNLKETLNKSLSCLVSCKKMTYYAGGGKLLWTIIENRNLFQQVYNNIRYTCINIIGGAYHKLPKLALGYRIDAVMVLPDGLEEVKKWFEMHKLLYKVDACVKNTPTSYINVNRMEEKVF